MLLLATAAAYYYSHGPGPTPSERAMDLPWWRPLGAVQAWEALAPLQTISEDYDIARQEGRWEPRGLVPLTVFGLPVLALVAIGFRLFSSALARVPLSAVALTLLAFVYYGWLDVETWRDYTWRWPIALFVTSFYLSAFALGPALVRAAAARGPAVRAVAALAFVVPIHALSTCT